MIYTLTLNPSLDYVVKVDNFRFGIVNRTCEEQILPGGKGINVSMVLGNMGYDSIALGYVAGFTGTEIERLLSGRGVRTEFILLSEGMSRINVKVRADAAEETGDLIGADAAEADKDLTGTDAAEETEINGMGPKVGEDALAMLFEKLDQLGKGDYLVLAGSIPASMPKSVYADVCERLSGRGVQIVVDATGDALLKTLPYGPFLIKPNHHELGALFGVDLEALSDGAFCDFQDGIRKYAGELQKLGARNVLISLGGKGAMLLTQEGAFFYADTPKGKVINTVGAGDSMVAGFLAGYLQGQAFERNRKDQVAATGETSDQNAVVTSGLVYATALRWGVCAGSASAFSNELATKEEVLELMRITSEG